MRVLYDGVVFQNTYQRGIQRVFREFIGRLPGDIEAVLALSGPAQGELPARGKVVPTDVPLAKAMPRQRRRRFTVEVGNVLAGLRNNVVPFEQGNCTLGLRLGGEQDRVRQPQHPVQLRDGILQMLEHLDRGQYGEGRARRQAREVELAGEDVLALRARVRRMRYARTAADDLQLAEIALIYAPWNCLNDWATPDDFVSKGRTLSLLPPGTTGRGPHFVSDSVGDPLNTNSTDILQLSPEKYH